MQDGGGNEPGGEGKELRERTLSLETWLGGKGTASLDILFPKDTTVALTCLTCA